MRAPRHRRDMLLAGAVACTAERKYCGAKSVLTGGTARPEKMSFLRPLEDGALTQRFSRTQQEKNSQIDDSVQCHRQP